MIHHEAQVIHLAAEDDNFYSLTFEEIDVFDVQKATEEEAKQLLLDQQIDGFITKDGNLLVASSGLNQTITRSVLDQIKQMIALGKPFENYRFDIDYTKNISQEVNVISIIFYASLGMFALYSAFSGIEITQINETTARLDISSMKKHTMIFSSVIIGLLLNFLSNVLLIFYLEYILKLQIFTRPGYSIALILTSNVLGLCIGVLLGMIRKISEQVKVLITIILTLLLAFFAGMMSPNILNTIEQRAPLIRKLNPVSIVSDNLMRINLLENSYSFVPGLLTLVGEIIVLLMIIFLLSRRKNYDSF